MLTQIETNKDRVREILRTVPQARDDDTVLYFMYAKLHTDLMGFNVLTPTQFANKVLQSTMPPSESLSRTRRVIQNTEGLYQGAKQKKRKAAAEVMRCGINSI